MNRSFSIDKNSINILLVDDNQDDVFLTKQTLKLFDSRFIVESAHDGERCLKKLEENDYDVMLLDYSLPGMNGISVLNAVINQGYDIPIIIVSGQGDESIAVKSIKKGAYDYIIKSSDYLKVLPVVIPKVIEKYELDKMKTKLEKETLDKKSKLEATLNSTSDGILMVSYTENNSYFISIINERFGEILDLGPIHENIENQTIESINSTLNETRKLVDNNSNNFFELYDDRKLEQADIVEDFKVLRRVIERYTGPVYDENRKIIGRIWSIRDVTERSKLEKRLKKLSITDHLTKLYNQGYFYEVLEKEIERTKRQNRKLSLILFDIDHFKEYNDTHGHQLGDKVIENIGKIVLSAIRENVDTGYRYGGDEFTIILPEANIEQAAAVAERIRQSFEEGTQTTLSLGLIELKGSHSKDEFVRCADRAMYLAKRNGGNQFYIYD